MNIRKLRLWVFSVIGYATILVILVAIVFIVVSGRNGKEPFVGGYCILWVKTGSMHPTIPEKSYILIKQTSPADVETGDVIVFISDDPSIEGQRNVPRVVQIIEDESGKRSFITRGDNVQTNQKNDEYPASGEKLIGKHVRVLSVLSIMGRLLSDTIGFLIIIVIILVILMTIYIPEISNFVKQADAMKDEKKRIMEEYVRLEVEKLKANGGILEIEPGKSIDVNREYKQPDDMHANQTE